MSGFQTPIKIKDAIDAIVARQYLLPAIQRKFVWSASKVEAQRSERSGDFDPFLIKGLKYPVRNKSH